MPTREGYYECAACGRCYKSTTIPGKCAVCGAERGGEPRREPRRSVEAPTEKFRLAAERAKGNFV